MPGPPFQSFVEYCRRRVTPETCPNARLVGSNIPIYSGPHLAPFLEDSSRISRLLNEWNRLLGEGPGVFVIEHAFERLDVIHQMTKCFEAIIAREKMAGTSRGDHFGDNERIWNSFQKSSIQSPHLFVDYYGNRLIALACRAWLGPHYQLTAQVNNVKPGSDAQSPHRDYHLGFQSNEVIGSFPESAQTMSQHLTLQGAVAHSDMPVESGPTRLLPFSQRFAAGYRHFRDPAFSDYFEAHAVQLPLSKGDLLFFNPALFHAAGSNRSANDRMANLLQISSAFGRAMESLDRLAMITAVYPELIRRHQAETLPEALLETSATALADGYAFPTNLDSDPPIDGNAPRTQRSYLLQAVRENWPWPHLQKTLSELARRRCA